ncbi:MAG: hypothetical protein EX271_09635 [Acidimicrobiales bacterium]|nr:hypothetical protein [Hyphomonadaceae bacterium]RZV40734.1 MAG: hypothetical protein EX271_09635 [Acidimicrobiales bacterium]
MLLRSLTKHVKDQNWFAVFLDFFIVVAGILIAFQITNWNEARVEADREREVLINILDDVKNDNAELEASIRMTELNIDAANYALIQAGLKPFQKLTMPIEDIPALSGFEFTVEPPREMTPVQKNRLWSLVVVRLHATQANSAYDSLVSAGDLSLIKSPDLIKALQHYHQQWTSLEGSQDKSYRPFRDQSLYIGQKYGLSPFIEMNEAEFTAILQANTDLASSMRTVLEYAVIHEGQLNLVNRLAEDLIAQLEQEIK